jgi:Mg-chelatase subunit ChlD
VAERNTNHLDALAMALELKPEVIFLMTDGEAKDDPTSGDIRKIQRIARKSGTRINVIHFVFEDRSNSTLESLAKRTGGQFKMINIRSVVDDKW